MTIAMKNNILKSILAAAAVIALAAGCSGFLDEKDQSKFIASTADHFSSVLLSEFNSSYDPYWLAPFMTDEVVDAPDVPKNTDRREQVRPSFCWQRDVEKNMTDYTQDDESAFWAYCYRVIAICNNVFENIDDASESQPGEKKYVRAEADFISALLYFNLVNLYAEPYRAETASQTMGVPIKDGTGIVYSYDRAMLDECYDLILSQLNEALSLIQESGVEYDYWFKINEDTVRIILSRVYLFMGRWDDAIATLEPTMKRARLQKMPDLEQNQVSSYNYESTWVEGNREIVYVYGRGTVSIITGINNSDYFNASPDLFDLYTDSDYRRWLWFNASTDRDSGTRVVIPWKGRYYYTRMGQIVLRYGEAYLNIAEAYARNGDVQTATSYLNTFLNSRHSTMEDVTIPTTQKELISFIMDERFREFCYEDHFRWFDLRRMSEEDRPEIEHTFKVMQNEVLVRTETYHLLKNDPNYTLALPYKEKDNNPMIMDYDRIDKVPY